MDGTLECIADGEEGNAVHSSKRIIDQNFHHVACTNDGATTRLSVDGVPDGTTAKEAPHASEGVLEGIASR